ncbi:MAG: hypothetical protein CMM50_14755 [Rhodospirillaceae bacterium]|nr:hypothetical protein [Rhodospirillaceae bacterium]
MTNRRRLVRLAFSTSCLTAILWPAANAWAQSPSEALATAYQSNPRLMAERARVRSVDEGVPQALSGWRPTVVFNGSTGLQSFTNETAAGSTSDTINPTNVALTIDQPLYRGGQTVASTEAAEARVLAARSQLGDVEQGVMLDAAIAYMNVVRDQSVVELNINNEQVLGRRLEATRDRFQVGEVTRTDVAQAEARLSDASALRVAAQGDLETSRANFEQIVGFPPEKLEFPDPSFIPPLPDSGELANAVALAENPALLANQYLEQAALHDIDVAVADLLPDLSLQGQLTKAYEPNSFFDESDSAQILANLRIPLYQSGAEYSRVRELREVAVQRRREVDQTRREVIENSTSAWESLVSTRAAIEALDSSVRANEIALEGVQQEAAVGARTTLDVLDAEQEAFDARVNLVRARRDEVVASLTLLAAIGRLSAEYLRLPVDIYDPAQHYQNVREKWIGFGSE